MKKAKQIIRRSGNKSKEKPSIIRKYFNIDVLMHTIETLLSDTPPLHNPNKHKYHNNEIPISKNVAPKSHEYFRLDFVSVKDEQVFVVG